MRTFAKGHTLIIFPSTRTYQYAILTCKFVNTGRVGLTLPARTTLLVVLVDDVDFVGIKGFTDKNIGNEF
jgi:hypothetical protein